MIAIIFPAVAFAQEPRTAEEWAVLRKQSFTNLKQIMLAMHNYHDTYRKFPAPYLSKDGKPLLSWRVALLPFFEDPQAQQVYNGLHRDEPWDSAHNKALSEKVPFVYRAPTSEARPGHTVYLVPRGDSTLFSADKGTPIRAVTDGTSNTIAVLEVEDAQAVPWTQPEDWPFDPAQPRVGFRGQYPGGITCALADGSAHFLKLDIDENILKALFTKSGGEMFQFPR
jgi:hypothetical protein